MPTSKIPLACAARFLESLTTTFGSLKGCFGSRCCLMELGPLWCVWLAFRVDALALIEMMNQINPTLGQRLIGDAFEVGAQSLGY